jgi:hypothetical protein
MAQSIASQCQSDCKSKITFSCQASETFHLCAQSADCANDSASPNCCMLRGQLVCVSDTLAQTLNNCQM